MPTFIFTTAAGATNATQAAAGVTVVGDMRLSGIAAYYLWSRGVNEQAQEIARQRYCAAYPKDLVCAGQSPGVAYIVSVQNYSNGFPFSYVQKHRVYGQIEGLFKVNTSPNPNLAWWYGAYGSVIYLRARNWSGQVFDYQVVGGSSPSKSIWDSLSSKILDVKREDGKPDTGSKNWKDWSQEKRNEAVRLLTVSDWQGLITSMPEGGRLIPKDAVKAPTIVIPGQEQDDPNTPADERILRKGDGFFTNPGGPNTDFDQDGTPDSADPEPQNPNVPRANGEPPAPSNESAPSEGEQEVDQVRDNYDDFLEKPENAG